MGSVEVGVVAQSGCSDVCVRFVQVLLIFVVGAVSVVALFLSVLQPRAADVVAVAGLAAVDISTVFAEVILFFMFLSCLGWFRLGLCCLDRCCQSRCCLGRGLVGDVSVGVLDTHESVLSGSVCLVRDVSVGAVGVMETQTWFRSC